MERYIGLDVHASSCTAAVINSRGKRLGSQVLETNGKVLVEYREAPARQFASLPGRGEAERVADRDSHSPCERAGGDDAGEEARAEERRARRLRSCRAAAARIVVPR